MQKQNAASYDRFSIILHWLIAALTIGLFSSGIWMVELDYYDNWYYRAPWWHTGMGIFTGTLLVIRWGGSMLRHAPSRILSIPPWQRLVASCIHAVMTSLILLLVASGYLMITLKGDALSVFDWFSIPSLITAKSAWVDVAGWAHQWLAYCLIALAAVHAAAALKHHFIDKDATLKRMLGIHRGEI